MTENSDSIYELRESFAGYIREPSATDIDDDRSVTLKGLLREPKSMLWLPSHDAAAILSVAIGVSDVFVKGDDVWCSQGIDVPIDVSNEVVENDDVWCSQGIDDPEGLEVLVKKLFLVCKKDCPIAVALEAILSKVVPVKSELDQETLNWMSSLAALIFVASSDEHLKQFIWNWRKG